jgi:hypothetical protein
MGFIYSHNVHYCLAFVSTIVLQADDDVIDSAGADADVKKLSSNCSMFDVTSWYNATYQVKYCCAKHTLNFDILVSVNCSEVSLQLSDQLAC